MPVLTSEFGIAQPGALGLGAGVAAVPVFTPAARALPTVGNRPYIGHLYTNAGVFKELIGPLVEAPSFKISINGGHHPLTVQIASKDPNALRGDLLELTEQGGDTTVVYAGIIEDLIEGTDPKSGYQLQLQPLVVELGDTPFSHEYYQQTDVAQMARDAVVQAQSYGKHLTYTGASIPLTGITGIYSFVNATALRVLEEAKKMGGPYFFYYVDENGLVTFGATNLGGTAAYEVRPSDALKVQGPISTLYNFLAAIGGTPLNATVPIASVYDDGVIRSGYPMANPQTAIGSQFGVRAQTNLAFDTNDQATLDQIIYTIGSQTNRVQTRVEMTLTGYPTRIVPGATLRYFEQAKYPMSEYRDGSGVESSVYVVMDNEIDGAVQKLVCSDIPISPDDLAYVIENRLRDALAATQVPSALTPLSPFQLPTLDPLQASPPGNYVPWNPPGGSPNGGGGGGGSGLQVVVDLTASQVGSLHSAPAVIVPAQGPGTTIAPQFVIYDLKAGGTNYASNTLLELIYAGGSDTITPNQPDLSNTGDAIFFSSTNTGYFISQSETENVPLVLSANTDPGGLGGTNSTQVASGGSGYAINDTFQVIGGNNDAYGFIDGISGGGVATSYQLTSSGTGYSVNAAEATNTLTGVGSGMTVDILTVTAGNGTLRVIVDYDVVALL